MDDDVWIYYMVELSFYWSLSISQFFDVKRKVACLLYFRFFLLILANLFVTFDSFHRCLGHQIRVRRSYSLKAKISENVGIFILALKRKKSFFFALFACKRNTPNSEKN